MTWASSCLSFTSRVAIPPEAARMLNSVAEEAYRYWLQGLTSDGKIPFKDLQETYDQAYASQLIPTPVNVKNVMDYTPLDEMLKEKR